jgi:hypothetical protein
VLHGKSLLSPFNVVHESAIGEAPTPYRSVIVVKYLQDPTRAERIKSPRTRKNKHCLARIDGSCGMHQFDPAKLEHLPLSESYASAVEYLDAISQPDPVVVNVVAAGK